MDKIVEDYMSDEEDGELTDEDDLFAADDDSKPATRKDEMVTNKRKQCIETNNKTPSTPVNELRDKRVHSKGVSTDESRKQPRLCPRTLKEHRPLGRQHQPQMSVQHHRHFHRRRRHYESIQCRTPRYTGLRIIAFSVRLQNDSRYSVPGDVVKFDKVIMNEGHAYNQQNGTFVCPEPGLYVLMWNISAPVGKTSILGLKINGLIKKRIISKRRIDEVDQCIYRLKADDSVWISFCRGCRNICDKYTKFGGIRISE